MESIFKDQIKVELPAQEMITQKKWQQIVLLVMLGFEAAGALLGGVLLLASPDGRYLDMPVDMMHGTFRDFLIPGIILFALGLLNAAAFFTILLKSSNGWIMAVLAIGGLAVWFIVEIAILQELHWLHFAWGLPVYIGGLAAIPLLPLPYTKIRNALLLCGIISSLLYISGDLLASWWYDGYSIVDQNYSELLATGAPTRAKMLLASIFYNLLVTSFAVGIWISASPKHIARITSAMMTGYATLSMVTPAFFQMDMRGAEVTPLGSLHPHMTVVMSLFILLTIGFGAFLFRKRFRLYSLLSIIILIVFGVLTSAQVPQLASGQPTPWMGLTERVNIYATMTWFAVLSIMLLREEKKQA